MAKNKKRKGTLSKSQEISPRKYLQTKVRQLPIYACYINEDWEQTKLAEVIIARKHTNGNLTFGAFLTDVLGMGVKDTMYGFNQSVFEFEELLQNLRVEMVACDYELAHNLVYGAVDFALEFDIPPHSDWKLTQFILEEDTEDIPLMDLEFGVDGKPVFLTEEDEEFNEYDEDEELEEDELLHLAQNLVYKTIDLAYDKTFPREKDDFARLITDAHTRLNITNEPIQELEESIADIIEDLYYELQELAETGNTNGIFNFRKKISDKIQQYPDQPVLYNYLGNSYFLLREVEKGTEIFKQCLVDFPDYLLGRLFLAYQLILNKKYDEARQLLQDNYTLQELMPKRKVFHNQEVYIFYAVWALYLFSYEKNLEKALPYYDLIISNSDESMNWGSVESAVTSISREKVQLLEKKYNKGLAEIADELGVLQI
ncbi:hypothetical protein J2X69_001169 [Algoriphagus sp. 4150]|uniref:hypothetical protein n=1 Tax=Algoriphagus sp. 4150 TaxID=2817756 RepID=UPI0028671E8F|nr:hypothetical protein [Algoriphagus sp. 4150]MDR7128837.1 hypothetical protein [Algoriphagus sp. 4150]